MAVTLVGPPGFDMEPYRTRLKHPTMHEDTPSARLQRRAWCKHSPILFGIYYFGGKHLRLRQPDGSSVISLSAFHVAIATSAKRWTRQDIGPEEVRDTWVASREAAKSTWLFLILSVWALAFGHRRYIVVYSDTEGQGKRHMRNLRNALRNNPRLRRDFPELCEPMKDAGKSILDNSTGYMAASGAVIEVIGMKSATLGARQDERRPDALFFDDCEPAEGKYSAEQKASRQEDMTGAIFPCNVNAVVQIAGTTVMAGSIIDDIMQGKEWVAKQNIKLHYFPPIIEDPVTGEEKSCWPERWSLEYLQRKRREDPRGFAKNFENRPVPPDGTYWDDDDIQYKPGLVKHIDERVLVLDPAAKSSKSNDETGLAILGWAGNVRTTVVERSRGVRLKPAQLRKLVHQIVKINKIKRVLVDVTNGGDWVLEGLSPLPDGARFETRNLRASKDDRFTELHYRCELGKVVFTRPFPETETQMKAYPRTLHDDRIDAIALGDEYFRAKHDVSAA